MKKSLIVFSLVTLIGSASLISACSSKQTKVETTATEPNRTPVQEQQQDLARDANLGASSSGRGR